VEFVSPETRFEAEESKATELPSPEMAGEPLAPLACVPADPTETREVVPPTRSWRKTSSAPLVSPETRFEAAERKAT
jgi:hypothetical protein